MISNSPLQNDPLQSSLLFEYPFLVSSGKKVAMKPIFPTQEDEHQKNPDSKNFNRSTIPIKISRANHNYEHITISPSPNMSHHSSFQLEDKNSDCDSEITKEIQILQQNISAKLTHQYSFLKQKLSQKFNHRQQLLKIYREISTLEPLQQIDPFQAVFQHQPRQPSNKTLKKKSYDSKTIKNKIIKLVQMQQNQQSTQKYAKSTNLSNPQDIQNAPQQNPSFSFTFRLKDQKIENKNPELFQKIEHRQVKSITHIDHSDLIRQMSEELKKMQFQKVEDIARGNFNFFKKK